VAGEKGSDVNIFLRKGDLAAGIGGDKPAITAAANQDLKIASLFLCSRKLLFYNEVSVCLFALLLYFFRLPVSLVETPFFPINFFTPCDLLKTTCMF
jgi:hypothetical protein